MENWVFFYEYAQYKHKEILKEADLERLIRKMRPKNKTSSSHLYFILNHLGGLMVKIGIFLQKKCRETPSCSNFSEYKLIDGKD